MNDKDCDWMFVPTKPTQAMCQAAQESLSEWPRFPLRVGPAYKAMLAAAPTPPERFPTCDLAPAARDVLLERDRQVSKEGYTQQHDDEHIDESIAAMACYYAMPAGVREWSTEGTGYGRTLGDAIIPDGWTAKDCERREELVKAAALILAEIERLDRADVLALIDKMGGAA